MPGWHGSGRQRGIQCGSLFSKSSFLRSIVLVTSYGPCSSVYCHLIRVPEDAGLGVALPRATSDVVVTLHEHSYQFYAPSLGHDRRDGLCSPLLHTPQPSYDSFKKTTERETRKTGERCGLQTRPDVRHAVRKTSAHVAATYIAISPRDGAQGCLRGPWWS